MYCDTAPTNYNTVSNYAISVSQVVIKSVGFSHTSIHFSSCTKDCILTLGSFFSQAFQAFAQQAVPFHIHSTLFLRFINV